MTPTDKEFGPESPIELVRRRHAELLLYQKLELGSVLLQLVQVNQRQED